MQLTILLIPCILIRYTLYTFSMIKPNVMEMETEIGNQLRIYVYRVPKKNHDSIVENQERFTETFRKHGCYYQSYQLGNTETSEGFASMASIVSANKDDEVWLDLEAYRDRQHMKEVVSKIESDEVALSLMKQYLHLLSPGSSPIVAEFEHVDIQGKEE
jgi:uncharacterized protein YbaA (DUF1428 family)